MIILFTIIFVLSWIISVFFATKIHAKIAWQGLMLASSWAVIIEAIRLHIIHIK